MQAWQSALGLRVTARAVTEEELSAALEEGTFSLAGINRYTYSLGNDAECFLRQWSSTGGENVSRYANSAYDTLLSVIAGAEDETARLGCLHDAEALLLEEGAVAPLYTTVTAWTLRDSLTAWCGTGGAGSASPAWWPGKHREETGRCTLRRPVFSGMAGSR